MDPNPQYEIPIKKEFVDDDPLFMCVDDSDSDRSPNDNRRIHNLDTGTVDYLIGTTKNETTERRKHNTQRRRIKLENQSEDERKKRKERAAYLARIRRKNLSVEEKQRTREADRERAKQKRASETPDERANRLARDAERKRQRRQQLAQFKKLLDELDNNK